ncbi:hypothetical protein [Leifsonia sp. NPDC058248]|uniref:hypothetical protein n=1 Tax=Leifsonia sp. NPDC058248 TaxID=3346402 RepID=UPI0036DBB432
MSDTDAAGEIPSAHMGWSRKKASIVLSAVSIVGLVAALTACTAAPPSRPSPQTTSPAAEAPPSPASSSPTSPSLTAVDTIIVHPTGIDLTASGVVQMSLAYTATAELFTSQLAAAIGTPAEVTQHPSQDYRMADSTSYEWPGLRIVDEHRKQGGPGPSPSGTPTLFLVATGPVIGHGITIQTVQGIKPGDTVASVAAKLGVDPEASVYFEVPAETGPSLGPSAVEGEINAAAVAVGQAIGNPSVVNVLAPYNFGDGHDI